MWCGEKRDLRGAFDNDPSQFPVTVIEIDPIDDP
jgi:hypothetical protein